MLHVRNTKRDISSECIDGLPRTVLVLPDPAGGIHASLESHGGDPGGHHEDVVADLKGVITLIVVEKGIEAVHCLARIQS